MPSDQENIEELQRQVRRQGELIDALYRRLGVGQLDAAGIPTETGDYPEVVDAINAGNKIQAIKAYRERTGLGLKEAKDAVEALERTMGR
jgi:large subunit ribosomal protein L7/L12